jgi:hypothetical protein
MPNNIRQQGVYMQSGDPETVSDATMYAPGQLGSTVTVIQPTRTVAGPEEGRAKTYQYVQTDSTMTTAPFKGAVAWWSDRKRYMVTTTPGAAARNAVAGIFQNDEATARIVPGNFCYVQKGGPASVKMTDATALAAATTAGLVVIPSDPSSTAGKAQTMAAGVAATHITIGLTAGSGNAAAALAVVELNIPDMP